jgi:hypothetical protein
MNVLSAQDAEKQIPSTVEDLGEARRGPIVGFDCRAFDA